MSEAVFDHALSPRLGQHTPIERPGILMVPDVDALPEAPHRGLLVYREDLTALQIYDGAAWITL